MPKHTAGPWRTILAPTQIVTDGLIIATLENAGSYDERLANARLLAAAPEMFEILRAIAEQFNEGAEKVYKDALWPVDDSKTLGQWINDTLADAEGGR